MKKAVFIRLDKIGDLVCTLPVDQVLFLKDWDITWVIAKGLAFVPNNSVPQRTILELDKNNVVESKSIFENFLREKKPDVAVSFQAPWWIHYLLWKNRVAVRIGVLSKWHSWLFLNSAIRQKRSRSVRHEADYNLELVRAIEPKKISEISAPVLTMKPPADLSVLVRHSLNAKEYVVVHPGMAGSALNWPVKNYIELIKELIDNYTVVITGTAADEAWLTEIKNTYRDHARVLILQSLLSADELLNVLAHAKAVFAPSTGVLHLAASLGTPVFGFYSPFKVQTVTRWGARGKHVHLFSPPGGNAAANDPQCMSTITVPEVLKAFR